MGIELLVKNVESAALLFEKAKKQEALAAAETSRTLNSLNTAQRELDAALAEMRKKAPRDSDWSSRRFNAPAE